MNYWKVGIIISSVLLVVLVYGYFQVELPKLGSVYGYGYGGDDYSYDGETEEDDSSISEEEEGGTSGGGGSYSFEDEPAEEEFYVFINNDEEETYKRTVELNLSGGGARRMQISNDQDFASSSVMAYATSAAWKLAGDSGEKYVYVKFFDELGELISRVSDRILLNLPIGASRERADINRDGSVDVFDFNALMVNWGKTSPGAADINRDGQAGVLDFNQLMVYWTS